MRARGHFPQKEKELTDVKVQERLHSLPFPQQVQAALQYLADGEVGDLHFGLYDREGRSPAEAQQRVVADLLPHLPASPARVLVVGCGLGSLCAALAGAGYRVTGIAADEHLVSWARDRVGQAAQLHASDFATFSADRGDFDALVFHDSARTIDSLRLFNRALTLLTAGGRLVFLDAFALKRTEPGPEALHLVDDLTRFGARLGLATPQQEDLSAAAAPHLLFLRRGLEQNRQRLLAMLSCDETALDAFAEEVALMQERWAAQRFGYLLLVMEKKREPKWLLSELDASGSDAYRALFAKIFKQEIDRGFWQRKYGEGRGESLAVWSDGRMVGHYGGIGRRILFQGRPCLAVQIGDVMVDVAGRGGMTRKGPYFLAVTTFFERYVGYGRKYLLAFGFPNLRAMRVANHLGLYHECDRIMQVRWPAGSPRRAWRTRASEVAEAAGEAVQSQVDALWRAMAHDLDNSIIGVRDWDHLRRRYLQGGEKSYRVRMVRRRFSGTPLGLFVARPEGEDLFLLDIVAPRAHFAAVIRQARVMANELGLKGVYGWITRSYLDTLQVEGADSSETEISIPMQDWTAGPDLAESPARWWLMAGDTDFL